jgi:hypothetical protein
MAHATTFTPNRLIMGILVDTPSLYEEVVESLETLYGPILQSSELRLFEETAYYDREMGGKPLRCWISFANLVDPSTLAIVKIATNAIEQSYLNAEGGRRVNLDPGMLSLSSLVLATAKDRAHRMALSSGIYGEVTLSFVGGHFVALEWTYADYRLAETRAMFDRWRSEYYEQLKREGHPLT